ncbi:MAG: hypothetical protein ACO1SV_04945 [Fimbriimonas sp.]
MFNFTRFTTPLVVLFALGTGLVQATRLDTGGHPQTIVPTSSTINAGSWVGMTVTLSRAGTTSTTVGLTSSHPTLLQVPSSVVVPANNVSQEFTALAPFILPDDFGKMAILNLLGTTVTVTATANGQSAQTTVTVL